jgi:hypothetical protein
MLPRPSIDIEIHMQKNSDMCLKIPAYLVRGIDRLHSTQKEQYEVVAMLNLSLPYAEQLFI